MVEKVIKIIVNTKEASSEIKTLFNDMVKREKDAQKESKKTEESIENIGTTAEKSGKKQVITVNKTSKAVEFLDKQTGGLASTFLELSKAAEKGGAAMKSALISTGIGAVVALVALLVENWDEISKFIGISNDKLQNKITYQTEILKITSDEYDLLKLQEENLQLQGKSLTEIRKLRKESLAEQLKQNVALLETLELQLEIERSSNKQVTLWEQIKIGALSAINPSAKGLLTAKAMNSESEKTKEINDKIKEAKEKILNIENETLSIDIKANKEAEDRRQKKEKADLEEQNRLDKITNLEIKYLKQKQDLDVKTSEQKLELQRKRAIEELNNLKGSEEEKREALLAINKLYDEKDQQLKKDNAAKELAIDDEIAEIKRTAENQRRLKALEDASKDENLNPLEKLEKQKEALELENTILEEDYLIKQQLYEGNLVALAKLDEDYKDKQIAINKELAENNKNTEEEKGKVKTKSAEFAMELQRIVEGNAVKLADQTLSNIASLAKEGSDLAKGVAVAQATMDTFKGAVSAYAAGSSVGGPAGLVLGPVSAALAVAAGLGNIKKILSTKPIEKGAPSGAASGGGAAVPQAPAFNLVEGSGTNQIAESIGGQNKPLQAFVVSSEVTTAQGLDRNIVDNSGF